MSYADKNHAHPVWSKLPAPIELLIEQPWRFNLFKAMSLIEKHWAAPQELEQGISNRVVFKPFKELGFPATDVRECVLENDGRGRLSLSTSFLGLYGVDAPMPHYVLEQAASDEQSGDRVRQFLDIFNHVLYCQLFQAWKKSQINIAGRGASQFDGLVESILLGKTDQKIQCGIASLKQTSAAGLAQLLKHSLNIDTLKVDDTRANWQKIDTPSSIGEENQMVLGSSAVLGTKVLVSGSILTIDIGPVNSDTAMSLTPRSEEGIKMAALLTAHLPSNVEWVCQIKVANEAVAEQALGQQPLVLGHNSYLGAAAANTTSHSYSHQQYKH
ncbi:type VI secretion system baseplate subunit TssG [Pseudoalteromonas arctica]|uniref:type VI secretion system baseplate subunit TssG n=1 Tax=Pseudoalteromonas arctica TaxID=394751 RepID=UPI00249459C7|nr:type VI secretion system baseplate subunit TssG [Pseudoalteromonas arctica]